MSGAARRVVLVIMAALALAAADRAWARQSMSFVPGDRTRVRAAAPARRMVRSTRHALHPASRPPARKQARGSLPDTDGPAAKAVPGAGFTLQDGVLTYPAPARFQPGNLKHR